MLNRYSFLLLLLPFLISSQIHYPDEKRLKNVKQLTFTGENAEGYFSFGDNFLTLQATGYGTYCDQIRLNATRGSADPTCPAKKCMTQESKTDPVLKELCNTQYTWDIYPDYDIFKVNEYGNILAQLTDNDVYDAEGVLSPDGKKILYTSLESGDLELYVMNVDGTERKQLTNILGYDGGGFFSPDSKKIIFRASRPTTNEEIKTYKALLSYNLVAPTAMELFIINVDGTGYRPVFSNPIGGANWAPYYLNDNKRIIFSSNFNSTGDDFNSFDLYTVQEDGTGLEKITFDGSHFDSFPMFSRSGKKLVWGSSRNGKTEYDLNLFIADWVVDDAELLNGIEENKEAVKVDLRSNRIITLPEESPSEPLKWQDLQTSDYDGIVHFEGEKHFTNVKQLTFGGENAEGYFSFDDSKLTLQATGYGTDCDQIYEIDLDVDPRQQILRRTSTGLGGTTFFFKEEDNNHRLYAGNFWNLNLSNKTAYPDISKTCPQKKCLYPEKITDPVLKQLCNASYTWDIFPDYDIFKVDRYGNIVQQLTDHAGYDAEAVLSPDGQKIAFTSIRSGDLDLWIMDVDGSNQRQLTFELGYDGGCFFSPDGKRLIFRASRPNTTEAIEKYTMLRSYNLVEPVDMELFVIDIDGQNMRQITHLGGANWAPYYLNDNKRIVFSSNYDDENNGFGAFSLYVINDDGTGLERVTYGDQWQFNSFAMMNYAGTKLVWGSSRNGSSMYDLNLFIADWVDPVSTEPTTTTVLTTTKSISFINISIITVFTVLLWVF